MNAQTPEAQDSLPVSPSPVKGLRLPEPDRENITVLLHNLPNAPVLPWNHYDSPWEGEESDSQPNEASTEPIAEVSSEAIAPPLEETVNQGESEVAPESLEDADLLPDRAEEIELPKIPFEPGFVNLVEGWSEALMDEESMPAVRSPEAQDPPTIVLEPGIQDEIPGEMPLNPVTPLEPDPRETPQETIEPSQTIEDSLDIEEKLLSQLG